MKKILFYVVFAFFIGPAIVASLVEYALMVVLQTFSLYHLTGASFKECLNGAVDAGIDVSRFRANLNRALSEDLWRRYNP